MKVIAQLTAAFRKGLNNLQKSWYYDVRYRNDCNWLLGKKIVSGLGRVPDIDSIAIQGNSTSYAAIAAREAFPAADLICFDDLEDVCAGTAAGELNVAILPLDNTTEGTVNEVYDLLLRHELYILKAISVPINHSLMAVPASNLNAIKVVLSHPQAIAQCRDYIRGRRWQVKTEANTAFAAERVAHSGDKTMAAIASPYAASHYGLKILAKNISNTTCNQTKFIAVCHDAYIAPDADTVSIAFSVPHQSGALSSVLSLFAELGINLTKIQSRPIPQKPWEYCFYLDFTSQPRDNKAMRALYQLEQELPFFHFLGWYSCHHTPYLLN